VISKTLLTASLLLSLSGCKSGPMPRLDVRFYAADSVSESVIHTSKDPAGKPVRDDQIFAKEPRFDSGLWLSYEDIKKIYVVMQSCKEWRPDTPMMSEDEVRAFIQSLGGEKK
jgi:hypothetical protein